MHSVLNLMLRFLGVAAVLCIKVNSLVLGENGDVVRGDVRPLGGSAKGSSCKYRVLRGGGTMRTAGETR